MRHAASALLITVLLAGCASAPLAPGCERFGRDGALCLLPPASLPAVDGSRLVSVDRDGHQDSFIGLLHVDDHDLRLVGLSLFGTSLFSVSYDGQGFTAEPKSDERYLRQLLVMLELAVADATQLEPRLQGITLETGTTNGVETRDFYEHGEKIAHLERSAGPLADATLRIDVPRLKLAVLMKPMPAAAP